jgi:hypothetical protein
METDSGPPFQSLMGLLAGERAWFNYFNQGAWWKPDGRDPVQIVDMPLEWRLNCVRFLERRASRYAAVYARGCEAEEWRAAQVLSGAMARDSVSRALETEAAEARADPMSWVRSTPLYQALAADLPKKPRKLHALAERAAHWDECGQRAGGTACTCERVRLEYESQKEAARVAHAA